MKFNKPISIRITPHYNIKEPITEEERLIKQLETENLGGLNTADPLPNEDGELFTSGGRMDWGIYQNPDYNLTAPVQLMRIWACQLVTQMVNNKAHVNEIKDEPTFDISDEEREVYTKIIEKIHIGLNDCLEKSAESMVINKKIKKVEL